jgi:hypothetical protein
MSTKKDQPKAVQAVQQPLPAWLERHAEAFHLFYRFSKGEQAVKTAMQVEFKKALADDEARGPVIGNVGQLIVSKGLAPSLYVDAFDSTYGNYMAGVVDHFVTHANQAGVSLGDFNHFEGRRIYEAYIALFTASAGDDFVSFLSARSEPCPNCLLKAWAYPQDRTPRSDIKGVVSGVLGELAKKVGDQRMEIVAALEAARAAEKAALEAEDGDALNLAGTEIARLEGELAALDAKPEATNQRVKLQTALEAAKAAKEAAKAVKDGNALKATKAEIARLEGELAALDAKPEVPAPQLVTTAAPAEPTNNTPHPPVTAAVPIDDFIDRVDASILTDQFKGKLKEGYAGGTPVAELEVRLSTLVTRAEKARARKR